MVEFAPISVGIPTWARGEKVFEVISRLRACTPNPAEIIVHVDGSDGLLERDLIKRFPEVRWLSSATRIGPGGGRDRCLRAATQPYFASFDDDSWPMDSDYFSALVRLFEADSGIGLISAVNIHPWEKVSVRSEVLESVVAFAGCGFAMRKSAYEKISGYVDRPWAYNAEEVDVALQLHAFGWKMVRWGELRVFHNTALRHHEDIQVTAAAIQNVALIAWLRYPLALWPRGMLQIGNCAVDRIRRGRWRGVPAGLCGVLPTLWKFRSHRHPLPAAAIRDLWVKRRCQSIYPEKIKMVGEATL